MTDHQPRQPRPPEALDLAASGLDLDGIADRLGVTKADAARRLRRGIDRARRRAYPAEVERIIEATHLDILRRALLPAALDGDVAAARLLVRVHQARALLLGLVPVVEEPHRSEEVSELDRIRARRDARRGQAEV